MNRRSFLAGISALVGGIAIDNAVPLGRVWSFPKEIKLYGRPVLSYDYLSAYERALREYAIAYGRFIKDNAYILMPTPRRD